MSKETPHGPYDHSNDCIEKACGLTSSSSLEERVNASLKKAREKASDKGIAFSVVVEELENSDLTRRELAYVIASQKMQIVGLEANEPLAALLSIIGRD